MKGCVVALAVILSLGATAQPVDVLVVGAGPAGLAAALAAAKSGAKTMVVERSGSVGGTAVLSRVGALGLFHAWGRQIVDGPVWTVVTNAVALDGGALPDVTRPMGRNHLSHCVRVNPDLYAAVAEESLYAAGVDLRLGAFPVSLRRADFGWGVSVATDAGLVQVEARQIVDATGNASVAAMAGAQREKAEDAVRQPGSFFFHLTGVRGSYDPDALDRAHQEAVASGELLPTDVFVKMSDFVRNGGGWGNYIPLADNSDMAARTETNRRGRASMLRILRFLRRQPGMGNVQLALASRETGVRETYRVVGESTITGEDYLSGRLYEDALSYSYWMIDPHDARSKTAKLVYLEEGRVATVPLSAMIPKGVENLLVAGRAVSSDHLANSALRVQGSCMAIGQAAGVAAAVAARKSCDARRLDLDEVKRGLRAIGAIVPDADCGRLLKESAGEGK